MKGITSKPETLRSATTPAVPGSVLEYIELLKTRLAWPSDALEQRDLPAMASAMLSHAMAGTITEALMITLPGSVRGVGEYLATPRQESSTRLASSAARSISTVTGMPLRECIVE